MAAVTICSDFGAKKIKSFTVSIVSPSRCYEVMGPDAMILVFWMLTFKPNFSSSSFTFIERLFSSLLSDIGWCHLRFWDYRYFSQQSWFQLVLHPAQHFTWCTLCENESKVSQSCPTLCNPMDCSRPGLPVHHQLPEFTQTHVHWVTDAI